MGLRKNLLKTRSSLLFLISFCLLIYSFSSNNVCSNPILKDGTSEEIVLQKNLQTDTIDQIIKLRSVNAQEQEVTKVVESFVSEFGNDIQPKDVIILEANQKVKHSQKVPKSNKNNENVDIGKIENDEKSDVEKTEIIKESPKKETETEKSKITSLEEIVSQFYTTKEKVLSTTSLPKIVSTAKNKVTLIDVLNPIERNPFENKTIPLDGELLSKDIFHTIKTSKQFHTTRAEHILLTWYLQVSQQTYFITDHFDLPFYIKTNGQLISSKCENDHGPYGLSCKMNLEFDKYIEVASKWWCHWDDDNYVNIKQLLALLSKYDWKEPWYIGKLSRPDDIKITFKDVDYSFKFAHGGSGFCVSRKLAEMMIPYAYDGRILELTRKTQLNDDCVIGLIINNFLQIKLTKVEEMNAHYDIEHLQNLKTHELPQQISLSYKLPNATVKIDDTVKSFSIKEDPTRFYSLHCMNFPETQFCQLIND